MQDGLKELEVLLDPYDWFYEARTEDRRYVVYVHSMEKEQDTIIPDSIMGRQVVVHFASNQLLHKNNYVISPTPFLSTVKENTQSNIDTKADQGLDDLDLSLPDDVEIPNTSVLTKELDRLEKDCGPNILSDIFFEIRDMHNAVTNLSARFPKVREEMVKLYIQYGFDAIYNELEL